MDTLDRVNTTLINLENRLEMLEELLLPGEVFMTPSGDVVLSSRIDPSTYFCSKCFTNSGRRVPLSQLTQHQLSHIDDTHYCGGCRHVYDLTPSKLYKVL